VITPKYHRKLFFGKMWRQVGQILRICIGSVASNLSIHTQSGNRTLTFFENRLAIVLTCMACVGTLVIVRSCRLIGRQDEIVFIFHEDYSGPIVLTPDSGNSHCDNDIIEVDVDGRGIATGPKCVERALSRWHHICGHRTGSDGKDIDIPVHGVLSSEKYHWFFAGSDDRNEKAFFWESGSAGRMREWLRERNMAHD
jgi:hypothetical protein